MPHDRNGKLVEVGDIVKGRGYNIKHDIIGPVVFLSEAESCNLTVGIVKALPMDKAYGKQGLVLNVGSVPVEGLAPNTRWSPEVAKTQVLFVDLEWGATKDFEIIWKAEGEPSLRSDSRLTQQPASNHLCSASDPL